MIYRGQISTVTSGKAFVEIPDLGIGQEFGPCEMMYNSLSVGDRVLCLQVTGEKEEIVIVGALSTATESVGGGSPDIVDGNDTNTTIIDGNI